MGKRLAIALGIVALMVALALVVQPNVDPAPPPPPRVELPPPLPPSPPPRGVRVTESRGRVERRVGDRPWQPLEGGDVLSSADVIRTGRASTAILDVEGSAIVRVAPRSMLTVAAITDKVSSLRLEGGLVSAIVRGRDDRTLRVEVSGSDAVATATEAEFSVLTDGKGAVTVAAGTGEVDVTARERSVQLTSGEQVVLRPGAGLPAPERIPTSLYLKLVRPPATRTRERRARVAGEVTPGAVVSINGLELAAADGRFETDVTLREGPNKVVVAARDAQGRVEEAALPVITVDTKPPKAKSEVVWER